MYFGEELFVLHSESLEVERVSDRTFKRSFNLHEDVVDF